MQREIIGESLGGHCQWLQSAADRSKTNTLALNETRKIGAAVDPGKYREARLQVR